MLTALETTASALVGQEIPMDAVPRMFMQASLGNILSRMDAAQMEQFSRIADPLVLIICAGVYAAKIINVVNQKKAENDETRNTIPEPVTGDDRQISESGEWGGEETNRGTLREYGVGNT